MRSSGGRRPAFASGVALALLGVTACAGARGSGEGTPASTPDASSLVPAGYGTLHQEDVSLELRAGELRVMVTPLAEAVIRLTAPDTYRRLHGIAGRHRDALVRLTGRDAPTLFLVSFFSMSPNVPYEPEEMEIVSRGLRHPPLAIRPVTPGWGAQRLAQREAQLAVYAFDAIIDLDADLAVEYAGMRNEEWRRILVDLQAERERVRARAGGRTP